MRSWRYCYRVASVVGLLSIEIFRIPGRGIVRICRALGKAVRFTNILRDVEMTPVGKCISRKELRRHG